MASIELVQANPKRPGSASYDRYEKYKRARSLEEMLQLGGSRADYSHDCKKGFIKVLSGEVRPAKKKKVARDAEAECTPDVDAESPRHRAKMAEAEADSEEEEEELEKISAAVRTVLGNISAGDCPWNLERAFVYCLSHKNLGKKGAFRVLVNVAEGANAVSEDAATLGRLCRTLSEGGEAMLSEVPPTNKSVGESAVIFLNAALEQDLIPVGDMGRLQRKFEHWLAGVPFSQTKLTQDVRPESEGWVGWPWEPSSIAKHAACGLKRGVHLDSLAIIAEKHPEDLGLPEDKVACFIEIWRDL